MLANRALAPWRQVTTARKLIGTLPRQGRPSPPLLWKALFSRPLLLVGGFTGTALGYGRAMGCDPAHDRWTEHTDPATGKTYYHNPQTGATSWVKPAPPPPAPPPPPTPPPPPPQAPVPSPLLLDESEVSHALEVAVTEMRAVLGGQKLSELKRRARAAGVPQGQLDDAEDSETPKESIVELIVTATRPKMEADATARVSAIVRAKAAAAKQAEEAKMVADIVATKLVALREELSTLKVSQLKKKATTCGVTEEQLDNAEDGESPRQDIEALILNRTEAITVASVKAELLAKAKAEQEAAQAVLMQAAEKAKRAAVRQAAEARAAKEAEAKAHLEAPLRSELSKMKVSQLKRRALDGGCSFEELEDAEDADYPKRALTELIVAQMHSQSHTQAQSVPALLHSPMVQKPAIVPQAAVVGLGDRSSTSDENAKILGSTTVDLTSPPAYKIKTVDMANYLIYMEHKEQDKSPRYGCSATTHQGRWIEQRTESALARYMRSKSLPLGPLRLQRQNVKYWVMGDVMVEVDERFPNRLPAATSWHALDRGNCFSCCCSCCGPKWNVTQLICQQLNSPEEIDEAQAGIVATDRDNIMWENKTKAIGLFFSIIQCLMKS
eukprot:COSAG02_NODE_5_length_66751_cov_63.939148_34_plen_611_part_00